MTTKTVTLYTFAELSDDAKERAREWWRELEAQDFGSDCKAGSGWNGAGRLCFDIPFAGNWGKS